MNNKKGKIILMTAFVTIVIGYFIFTYIKSKTEFETAYNFVITDISATPTKSLNFYSSNKEITLWNYIISENQGLKIGDSICKKENSRDLYVFRKGEMFLKVEPTGIFFPCFENF